MTALNRRTTLVLAGLLAFGVSGCGKRAVATKPFVVAQPQVAETAPVAPTTPAPAPPSATPPKEVKPVQEVKGISLPREKGDRVLAEAMAPTASPVVRSETRKQPLALKGTDLVEHPEQREPMVAPIADLPRLDLVARPIPSPPRSLPDEAPFSRTSVAPDLPSREGLPSQAGARLASPDPENAIAVPLLAARPVADPAPIDDPTSAYSSVAAVNPVVPDRATPTPFMKLTLPDPFEHAQTIKLRTPPAEESAPSSPAPKRQ